MNIEGLSNQELLRMIITMAVVGLVFALTFIVSLVRLIRGRRKPPKDDNELRQSTQPDWEQKSPTGGREETMSLLKAIAKNTEQSPVPSRSYETLLTVLVDPNTKEIVVDVDGQQFSSISLVKSRTIGQRILETTAALLKFTGGFVATASGTKTYPIPDVALTSLPVRKNPIPEATAPPLAAQPQSEVFATSPIQSEAVDPEQEKFLADLEARTRVMRNAVETEQAKPRWGGAGRRPKQDSKKEKTPTVATFNLAGEIDQLVQQKLHLANEPTAVKIDSAPGGLIAINVGGKSYEMVDDIEDGPVKAIIKEAIKEWSDSR